MPRSSAPAPTSTGIAIGHFGVPWFAAVPIGVLAGGAVPCRRDRRRSIRTRGIYFSMVTLALAQLVYYVALQASSWTGGENGLRGFTVADISLFGFPVDFLDPRQQLLRADGLRGAGAVVRVAHPELAVRGRHRGHPRERAAGAGLRL